MTVEYVTALPVHFATFTYISPPLKLLPRRVKLRKLPLSRPLNMVRISAELWPVEASA